jgi:uncharacterized protein (TIGR00730 family)
MILTVFCSSKSNIDLKYHLATEQLINLIDKNKFAIAYGGGSGGLMGTVRRTYESIGPEDTWVGSHPRGGKIISSNVDRFVEPEYPDDYVYDNIDERQKKLMELGNAYLILPGGYGTHFEMLEVMTKNDIGEASKPIFLFNFNGIFDNFIKLIDNLINEGFITRNFTKIKVFISDSPSELANMINTYNFV